MAAFLNGGIYETRVGSLRGEMPVDFRTNRFTGAMKICFPTGACTELPKEAPTAALVAANDFLKGAVPVATLPAAAEPSLNDDLGILRR